MLQLITLLLASTAAWALPSPDTIQAGKCNGQVYSSNIQTCWTANDTVTTAGGATQLVVHEYLCSVPLKGCALNQCYDDAVSECFYSNALCTRPEKRCGPACYSEDMYTCVDGALAPKFRN